MNREHSGSVVECLTLDRGAMSLQGRRRLFKSGPAEEAMECQRHETLSFDTLIIRRKKQYVNLRK